MKLSQRLNDRMRVRPTGHIHVFAERMCRDVKRQQRACRLMEGRYGQGIFRQVLSKTAKTVSKNPYT